MSRLSVTLRLLWAAALTVALQLHRNVAGIGFCHLRESQLQASAARRALYFGRFAEDLFHVRDHAIGLFQ